MPDYPQVVLVTKSKVLYWGELNGYISKEGISPIKSGITISTPGYHVLRGGQANCIILGLSPFVSMIWPGAAAPFEFQNSNRDATEVDGSDPRKCFGFT
jgi:hypothetical protein